MQRRAVQFHWRNQGYATFDDFLAHMTHEKRKKIKQERRKLRELGIEVQRIDGSAMQEWHWRFFFDCYRRTYRLHHSQPYLNLAFFLDLGTKLAQHVVLILATHQGRPVAAALNLSDGQRLYGRYWGSVEFVPGLHFELCYYQGIDFCIERALQVFEGGAQGEHKLARGLLPVTTHSAHWIAHPGFAKAIGEFLRREGAGVGHYVSELEESAPFRQANPSA